MSISSFIRQIGRGKKGSSDLTREEAQFVFSKILASQVSQIELGAFCIAMRIKGETPEELAGFMDAIRLQMNFFDNGSRKTIILPSYNGSRKQLNYTPLLAKLLSDLGFLVIVQGIQNSEGRITSHEIFSELGWPIVHQQFDWKSHQNIQLPIFIPLDIICEPLQRLLNVREQIGLRNSGHVLAKLLNPCTQSAWQVSNYTHPEYPEILAKFFQLQVSQVVFMRGHEGEPTASPGRLPEMTFLKNGTFLNKTTETKYSEYQGLPDQDLHGHVNYLLRIFAKENISPLSISEQANLLNQFCT